MNWIVAFPKVRGKVFNRQGKKEMARLGDMP
jgi:hypothetical protein